MTPERFEQISEGGWVRFSDRAIYRVTGEDRVRYLGGQLSNAVAKAANETVYACVLDVKGRLQGELFLHEGEGFHLIDTPAVLREPLVERLDRYLVADDVVIEGAEDDWVLLHFFDPKVEAPLAAIEGLPEGSICRPADRLAAPGLDLLLPSASADEWIASSVAADLGLDPASPLDDAEATAVALLRGRPTWGGGLEEGRLLPEAGIEDRAVDYHKGCYVGQEVVSRIRSAGKINWTLRPLSAEISGGGDSAPALGTPLREKAENEAREVGVLAACLQHPCLDQFSALAYVRSSVDADQPLFLSVAGDESQLIFTAR